MSTGRGGRWWRRQVDQVLAVYGATCHLCLLPIRLDLPKRHPDGPSADHLIPVKHGGRSTLDNLRPAHRRCNYKRGAKPLTKALLESFRNRRAVVDGSAFFVDPPGHPAPPVPFSPDSPKKDGETAH